jgi:hypothetical protein
VYTSDINAQWGYASNEPVESSDPVLLWLGRLQTAISRLA